MNHDIELKEYNILEDAVFIVMITKVDLAIHLFPHLDLHLAVGLLVLRAVEDPQELQHIVAPVLRNTYSNNK